MKTIAEIILMIAVLLFAIFAGQTVDNLREQIAEQEEVIRTLENQVNTLQHLLFEQEQHESPDIGADCDA